MNTEGFEQGAYCKEDGGTNLLKMDMLNESQVSLFWSKLMQDKSVIIRTCIVTNLTAILMPVCYLRRGVANDNDFGWLVGTFRKWVFL